MKKQLLTLIPFLTYIVFPTSAQTVRYGIKGGLNLSKQKVDGLSSAQHNLFLPGLQIGGIVDIGYTNLSIQPGLFFSSKGYHIRNDEFIPTGGPRRITKDDKDKVNYLELPVNVLYRKQISKFTSFHIGGGPYMAYGLSAKNWQDGKETELSFGNDVGGRDAYKRLDFGANFLAGAILNNNYIIDINYGLGISNLAYFTGYRVLSFTVGYMF
jgi:hypothetical protein